MEVSMLELDCIVCMYEQRIEAEGRKHGHSRTCWRQSAYVRRWRSTPTCVQRESQSSCSTIRTKRTSRVLSTNWTASATVQFIPSSGCMLCRPTTATKSAAAPASKRKHKSYIGPCSIDFSIRMEVIRSLLCGAFCASVAPHWCNSRAVVSALLPDLSCPLLSILLLLL